MTVPSPRIGPLCCVLAMASALLFLSALASGQERARTAPSRVEPSDMTAPSVGTENDSDTELPPGHPDVAATTPRARTTGPHTQADVFEPPEDVQREDSTLPPGTIAVDLRDGDDKPVPGEGVTLGILINSIAKGDSRKHMMAITDEHGTAVFSGVDTASNVAYRVSSGYQGGLFAATPFQFAQGKAMRVVLHVYPVTHDIQSTLILCEAVVVAELRDDRLQIEEAFTIYNLGRMAWEPEDVTMSLPPGFTAFTSQPSMSNQGADLEEGGGAKLHGTFPPGHHPIQFRWQLPWSGDKDVDFDVGMPPHVAIARVVMPATSGVHLTASGFPPAEVRHDAQGQSFLVSERRVRPDEPKVRSLAIGIHDLPTPGPGRIVATVLAAIGVATGLFFVSLKQTKADASRGALENQQALLAELAALEDARASGEVGPRTYERARRELMDSIALTLASAQS